MKNKISLFLALTVAILGFGLALDVQAQPQKKKSVVVQKTVLQPSAPVYVDAKSLDIVANPTKYLNKRVKINAKFDKFSTLGLDYKPAFRSSEKYISFLIKRDDVINHVVPLSEMKIFMKREVAEKHIDLEPGDIVEFDAYVFSNALGDPWLEVENFRVLSSKAKDKKVNSK
ncbi:MAG TPA: hypothetical protein PLG15_06385 [Candidatus Gastranaerophilaceae bacterium]|nr:hypothetical protein [Candidatus Gastranaerophilaceae bacterium]HPT41993.1 hypothetical protein [Candidatus Gastranaerophilaceae bacterium]